MSATTTHSYERQCGAKRTYLNQHDAKRALKQLRTIYGGPAMNTYRCPWCSRYHIGHKPQR